jgi:predicted ATP-grasp superfamily ATP-dependent carboligase
MNYILVGKHGRPSIRAVSEQMNQSHTVLMRRAYVSGNIRWFKLVNNSWVKCLPLNQNPTFQIEDKIIRWGISTNLETNGATIYQHGHAIDTISNKYETRRVLSASGVYVPKTSMNPSELRYPLIARPIHHSRGRNFHVLNTPNDHVTGRVYYSEIYPKKEEVRVYVAHGKVLSIRTKPLVEGVIQANRAITHDEWGVVPREEYSRYYSCCMAACKAVKAVGADNGGVDVMINRELEEGKRVCVCEINSAPTIKSSELNVQKYAKYFDWLFNSSSRRAWWPFESYTRGNSFIFMNEQLEV